MDFLPASEIIEADIKPQIVKPEAKLSVLGTLQHLQDDQTTSRSEALLSQFLSLSSLHLPSNTPSWSLSNLRLFRETSQGRQYWVDDAATYLVAEEKLDKGGKSTRPQVTRQFQLTVDFGTASEARELFHATTNEVRTEISKNIKELLDEFGWTSTIAG
ncbi:hypothetical protein IFR04_013461 [Cadophora malorum]|uniref:Uncharacterized protein n=1 Tax=Cadophora malorum TaxID=108018 RepID=A0A8H7T6M7_9HELO|nr:hypothetical protein IFR04_013461 [Cadophora malorum]